MGVHVCVVFTFCFLMVLRENMDESLESAMETPGRSIFSATLSLCFLCSFSSFLFFLMEHDSYTNSICLACFILIFFHQKHIKGNRLTR